MKKITIIALGSRGDIQPYCALALSLKNDGFDVLFVSTHSFVDFIQNLGLKVVTIAGDYKEMLKSEKGLLVMSGNKSRKFMTDEIRYQQMKDAWNASQDSDLIICMPLSTWAYHIAEKLRIPICLLSYVPLQPTRFFPILNFQYWSKNLLFHFLNRWSYKLAALVFLFQRRKVINRFRKKELNLPSLPRLGYRLKSDQSGLIYPMPIIHHFSSHIIPTPLDWKPLKDTYQTSFIFLNLAKDYQPPSSLIKFITTGNRPLFIGFGSMMLKREEQQKFSQIILEAIERSQQKAVIVKGWGAIDLTNYSLNSSLYIIDDVPYDWLLPQVSLAIHHGGSGTSSAVLRAGIPSIIIPFFGDQPAWAKRLEQLGVALPPLSRQKLSAQGLSDAIKKLVSDPSIQVKSNILGEKIQRENGLEDTINILYSYLK